MVNDIYAVLNDDVTEKQRTVANILFFKGIGLHTGKETSVVIKPAASGHGITFARKDINPYTAFKADASSICSTTMRTSIGMPHAQPESSGGKHVHHGCISTVEHLMSALWGAGIDNAAIEVYGGEIPAMDGSAAVFYEALHESGIKEQNAARKYIEILRPIILVEEDIYSGEGASNREPGAGIAAIPSDDFEVSYVMDFKHPLVSSGYFEMKIDENNFHGEISKARTFGFLKDVEYLKKNGLALGGSLDNALVLDETSVLNEEGLRYENEFIRHKVLDLIGDLYLSGYRIKGKIVAKKTGHDINSRLVKRINELLSFSRKVSVSQSAACESSKEGTAGLAGAAAFLGNAGAVRV